MKTIELETDLMSFPTEAEAEADIDRIVLNVFKGGVPQTVSGTPSILFMRPNGTSTAINQNGSVSGNQIAYSIPSSCYASSGKIMLALILTSGSVRTTLGLVRINVRDIFT